VTVDDREFRDLVRRLRTAQRRCLRWRDNQAECDDLEARVDAALAASGPLLFGPRPGEEVPGE
jgi:hypothetical protein